MSEEKPKVDVNVVQVVASALAAVSSAVLLSTVGVAGTIIGAAVGSVVATVGSAVYSYSLHASRARVAAAAQLAASARIRRPGPDRTQRTREQQQLPPQVAEAVEEAEGPSWREALSNLPWKRVAAVTLGVFAAAMVAIVSFELVAGRPVSTLTNGTTGDRHGTSIPGIGGGSKSTPTKSPTPSGSASPTPSPTGSPTGSPTETTTGPTESPTQSSNATPSASPTTTPTGLAGTPTATGSGSASPLASPTGTPTG